MERLTYHLFFAFVVLYSACSPKYFEFDKNEFAKKVCCVQENPNTCLQADINKFDHYQFKLTPFNYFKNNRMTTALFSKNMNFIDQQLLYVTDPKDSVVTFLNNEDILLNSWYSLDLYLKKQNNVIENNSEVFIVSTSGKNGANSKELAKGSTVFYGQIHETSNEKNQKEYIITISHFLRLTHKNRIKTSFKVKDKKHLFSIIVTHHTDSLEYLAIKAIIDSGYNRAYDRATIYDMNNLFNSDIWLEKK